MFKRSLLSIIAAGALLLGAAMPALANGREATVALGCSISATAGQTGEYARHISRDDSGGCEWIQQRAVGQCPNGSYDYMIGPTRADVIDTRVWHCRAKETWTYAYDAAGNPLGHVVVRV
jgi:hypothetical protein